MIVVLVVVVVVEYLECNDDDNVDDDNGNNDNGNNDDDIQVIITMMMVMMIMVTKMMLDENRVVHGWGNFSMNHPIFTMNVRTSIANNVMMFFPCLRVFSFPSSDSMLLFLVILVPAQSRRSFSH